MSPAARVPPAAAPLAALLLGACEAAPPAVDYGPYLDHMPRSILVLPPLETTPEVEAPYRWLTTITKPLAERGYYVFPVALVDLFMKENGLPTPGEMHDVPPAKLGEIFGADAVLYVTIVDWGTSYEVIQSETRVAVSARLVDTRTGVELWSGDAGAARGSGDGGGSLVGALVAAVVNQVVTAADDPSPELARSANASLVGAPGRGLLLGPYHPGFEEEQRMRRAGGAP